MPDRRDMTVEAHVVSERLKGTVRRTIVASPEAVVEGWAFAVTMPAFAAALDVVHAPYVFTQTLSDGRKRDVEHMLWTRGTDLAFEVGDTFHAPQLPAAPWGEQKDRLTHTIQVARRQGDILELLVHDWKTGRAEYRRVTQQELGETLKSGLNCGDGLPNREGAPSARR